MRYEEIVRQMQARATGRPMNRRTFALGGLATAATAANAGVGLGARPLFAQTPVAPIATPVFGETPFTLGVASGEPLPDGVVLWTRLAPHPFEVQGGMGPDAVEVRWQVADEEGMTRIVRQGVAVAEAHWGHSVHVEVSGLEPDRPYWYRFIAGSEESPVGRTKTAPAPGTIPKRLRFAFASCQSWDQGLYTAYRDLARQDVDLVVHLGDYIYESSIGLGDQLRPGDYPGNVLSTPRTLEDYRNRYALYKLDPHLQEAHRVAPWLVTWDDHEVDNNYFGEIIRDVPVAQALLELRAAAYQAYYEHQPLRLESRPVGPDLQLFRHRTFGDLVEFNVLDTRQYRSPQGTSCNAALREEGEGFCPASLDPERTLLGERQKSWLTGRFDTATARWNVLAQQIPFARIDNEADPGLVSYGGREMDKWDGYAFERDQVAAAMCVHLGEIATIVEFVGTSISSNGDEALEDGGFTTECGDRNGNLHNHFYDNHRGYVLCDVTPDRWEATYRVMPTVLDDTAEATTLTSFVVEHGRPGTQVATTCDARTPGGE